MRKEISAALIFVFFVACHVNCHAYTNLYSPEKITLRLEDGRPINLGIPVSVVRIDKHHLAVANYIDVWVVNDETGEARRLKKPEKIQLWYPTGLAYDMKTNELFIANYLGKDVLILERDEDDFKLKSRIQDSDLIGGENISLSGDGKYFSVADFDNSGVLLFDRADNKKIWYRKLGRAHGVSFNYDDSMVVASGLTPPQIAKFDLRGNQVSLKGDEGWLKNGYLWPTSIAVDPTAGEVWISDAHLGKIRSVDGGLEEIMAFGSNGIGQDRFNMPYGIFYESGGKMWVTDTFKSRLLLLDKDKNIIKSLISMPESDGRMFNCRSGECVSKEEWFSEPQGMALGEGYQGRTNIGCSVKYDFGVHGMQDWNPGYGYTAFSNSSRGQLALAGSAPLFSSSIFYWVQALPVSGGMIYGSPQVREWMVDLDGMVCPVTLGLNYWVEDEGLSSDQIPNHKAQDIVAFCLQKYSKFKADVAEGKEPFSAYVEDILEKSVEVAMAQLASVFQSDKGMNFYSKICSAQTHNVRRKAALDFVESLQDEKIVFLPELWIAKLFSAQWGGKDGSLNCNPR